MGGYQNAELFHRARLLTFHFFLFSTFITTYTNQFRLENELYHVSKAHGGFRTAPHLSGARLHTAANATLRSPRLLDWSALKPLFPLPRHLPGTGRSPEQLSALGLSHTLNSPHILPNLVFTLRYCNPGGNFRLVQTWGVIYSISLKFPATLILHNAFICQDVSDLFSFPNKVLDCDSRWQNTQQFNNMQFQPAVSYIFWPLTGFTNS